MFFYEHHQLLFFFLYERGRKLYSSFSQILLKLYSLFYTKSFRCSFKEKELTLESHLTAAVVRGLQRIFYRVPSFKPYCKPPGGSETVLKTQLQRHTRKKGKILPIHAHAMYKNKQLL